MLLFLNYVEEIELSHVDASTKQPCQYYKAHAEMSEDDKVKRQRFHEKCQQIGKKLKSGEISLAEIKQETVEYQILWNIRYTYLIMRGKKRHGTFPRHRRLVQMPRSHSIPDMGVVPLNRTHCFANGQPLSLLSKF